MSDFNITREHKDGVALIRVQGFLDAHTFEQLEEIIREVYDEGCFKLVVDLAKVDYISSAGAGVFIGAIGTAQENSGNIILMNPTPNVKEVFDLLGLSQLFQFAETIQQALTMF